MRLGVNAVFWPIEVAKKLRFFVDSAQEDNSSDLLGIAAIDRRKRLVGIHLDSVVGKRHVSVAV